MDAVATKGMIDQEDRHWWHRGRRRIVEDEVSRLPLPSGARILDAGCGSGHVMDLLSRFGSVSGLEYQETLVELVRARGHADVEQGVVEEMPWPEATFDLVTSLDVVEHTADDRRTLREFHRVTRPGGFVLITVPAYQALWSYHDVLYQHYRRYDRPMLRALAAETGFTVERITGFNSILLPPVAAVRLAQKFQHDPGNGERGSDFDIGPQWLHPVLDLPMRAEAVWLRRGRTLAGGLSLLAVLRR